jgi:hypothetical protein
MKNKSITLGQEKSHETEKLRIIARPIISLPIQALDRGGRGGRMAEIVGAEKRMPRQCQYANANVWRRGPRQEQSERVSMPLLNNLSSDQDGVTNTVRDP